EEGKGAVIRHKSPFMAIALFGLLFGATAFSSPASAQPPKAYGIESNAPNNGYLQMPKSGTSPLPRLLSQTGAFAGTPNLRPAADLIPYDIIFPFWSDGATKSRWMAPPTDVFAASNKIAFATTGEWKFPKGTVFVKHFELATDETLPEV